MASPLYFGEAGPTIQRENAEEYSDARRAEHARAHFVYVFDLPVELVEVERD